MRILKQHSRKIGLPPGSIIPPKEEKFDQTKLTAFTFDADGYQESTPHFKNIPKLLEKNGILWINIDGLANPELISFVGNAFGIHDLVLEDILTTDQRPKIEDHERYIFFVLEMIRWDSDSNDINMEQVSIILGDRFVISFQEREGDVFTPIRERFRHGRGRIRKSQADYMTYTLLDAVVDQYFSVIDHLGEMIENVESEALIQPNSETPRKIHALRLKALLLHQSIWPLREVISSLKRLDSELLNDTTPFFIADLYDHTIQLIDALEAFRDMPGGLFDIYLSNVSNRMNEVMKVLTIISTIFIPLTFLAGVYGMNFKHMPELHYVWAYPLLLIGMVTIAAGMIYYFKRKDWL